MAQILTDNTTLHHGKYRIQNFRMMMKPKFRKQANTNLLD